MILLRYFLFFFGLTCYGLGSAIAVQVKFLGLHPWEVLHVALFQQFGFSIGTWSILCGAILILFALIFNRKYLNIGTFLNALSIGLIMDFFLRSPLLPHASDSLWINLLILLLAITISGIGGGVYVAAGIGAGPRDGFMLALSEKTGLSVSRARILVETFVLLIGYLLGGPVFIVSFLYTFIQSPIFQFSLKWMRIAMNALQNKKMDVSS